MATDTITTAEINLSDLTPAQLASILSQLQAKESAAKAAKQAVALGVARDVVNAFECEEFSSGAVGVSLGGRGDVSFPDGTTKNVTVSVLVRVTSTIPKKAPKA